MYAGCNHIGGGGCVLMKLITNTGESWKQSPWLPVYSKQYFTTLCRHIHGGGSGESSGNGAWEEGWYNRKWGGREHWEEFITCMRALCGRMYDYKKYNNEGGFSQEPMNHLLKVMPFNLGPHELLVFRESSFLNESYDVVQHILSIVSNYWFYN